MILRNSWIAQGNISIIGDGEFLSRILQGVFLL